MLLIGGNKTDKGELVIVIMAVLIDGDCHDGSIFYQQTYLLLNIVILFFVLFRNDFMFSGVISKEMLAFSDPTPHGKQLAQSYCGTEHFLVFR